MSLKNKYVLFILFISLFKLCPLSLVWVIPHKSINLVTKRAPMWASVFLSKSTSPFHFMIIKRNLKVILPPFKMTMETINILSCFPMPFSLRSSAGVFLTTSQQCPACQPLVALGFLPCKEGWGQGVRRQKKS